MKKTLLGMTTAVIAMAIVGCDPSTTGTAYYVDNGMEGIQYECGSHSGDTASGGGFSFEIGQECKFSIAGVPLRSVEAKKLLGGGYVLEDQLAVAKLLQSIDANGDTGDGIQITKEVLAALKKALEDHDSAGKLPTGDTLTEVVAAVGHDVDAVSGDVKSDAQVETHLNNTRGEILKKFLSGKTLYEAADHYMERIRINDDASRGEWEVLLHAYYPAAVGEKGTYTYEYSTNKGLFVVDGNKAGTIDVNNGITEKYIEIDFSGSIVRLYNDKQEAINWYFRSHDDHESQTLDMEEKILGTWKKSCSYSHGEYYSRVLAFGKDGTYQDTKTYYGTDSTCEDIEATRERNFHYSVGDKTEDLNGNDAYELDRWDEVGHYYYSMFKFTAEGNLLKAGDREPNLGTTKEHRANYFDPSWDGFGKSKDIPVIGRKRVLRIFNNIDPNSAYMQSIKSHHADDFVEVVSNHLSCTDYGLHTIRSTFDGDTASGYEYQNVNSRYPTICTEGNTKTSAPWYGYVTVVVANNPS